ncbi:MAG: tRNA pseudouridine synthase B [Microgenomates bacterium OLB23]|nr:MAG: tRNA pseudouridine synthase B [Microgenomates bacterium OLB23]
MTNQSTYSHSPLVKAIYKREGITPLQAVIEFKTQYPHFANEKISYAGRLDPMADGVLLLLIGEANKERNQFLFLQKSYTVEVLFGIYTDSYDVLGVPQNVRNTRIEKKQLQECLAQFVGTIHQKFPPYSSKPVRGKPLYYWAREGKLHEVNIPVKERYIDAIQLLSVKQVAGKGIVDQVIKRILQVQGNFRQSVIINAWTKQKHVIEASEFTLASIKVIGSSGLYMRQLCVDVGEKLRVPALAYHITRTHVGEYTLNL